MLGCDLLEHFAVLAGFEFPEFEFSADVDVLYVFGKSDDELFDGVSSKKVFKFFNVSNLVSHFHHVFGSLFQKYSVREIFWNADSTFFQYLVSQFHYSCSWEGLDLQQSIT